MGEETGRLIRKTGVLLPIVASVMLIMAASASASYYRSYGVCWQDRQDLEFNGARQDVEVRSGEISDADANAGRFIIQNLWIITHMEGGEIKEWVETGVRRGWITSPHNIMTAFWAEQHYAESSSQYVFTQTRITNTMTPGDFVFFKILHISGMKWGVYIEGNPAQTTNGDYTAESQNHDYFHKSESGLESVATTAKYGSSANWADVEQISTTLNHGSSWSSWSSAGILPEDDPHMHVDWDVAGAHLVNYRNW